MKIQVVSKDQQAYGAFNGGQIIENKPIGFPQDGGTLQPYSNLFYWAYAEAKEDSTIGLHPHQGFEIMSFVLKGEIRHFDTKLEEWRPLKKGDAQIIRAGNGISHSEFMAKDSAMFQIWLDPNLNKTLQQEASYDDYTLDRFPVKQIDDWTITTYIGANSPFQLDTPEIEIERIKFTSSKQSMDIAKGQIYSIYVLKGNPCINGEQVVQDDYIVINDANTLDIVSEEAGEIFVISSPSKIDYMTYKEMMQARMRR